MIGMEVNYKGMAAVLSYMHRRNLWSGTAPFGRAMRQGFFEALAYWHENILPRHFESSSQRAYRYQRRKKPYRKIKRRLAKGYPSRGRHGDRIRGRHARVIKGGRVDIVRSGQTERMAESTVNIVAGTKQGRATINVPFYITQRSRQGRPRMDQEIKEMTPGEITEVSDVNGKAFFRQLNKEGRTVRARKFVVRPR